MKLFGRKGSTNETATAGAVDVEPRTAVESAEPADTTAVEVDGDAVGETGDDPVVESDQPLPSVPTEPGPLDVSQVDGIEGRVDLGALWIPAQQGMELRLELEEKTRRVIAATVALEDSAVQLQAFAAPRGEAGLWGDIRTEIKDSVVAQGGGADEVPGSFGRELMAKLPSRTPEGTTTHQPARFVGIDGQRWFVRAVFTGKAAFDAAAAEPLERLVRGTVVVRGGEAMAPREMLALRLPPQAKTEGDETAEAAPPLNPYARGPEITEIR